MAIFKVRLNREIYVEAKDEVDAQSKALQGFYGEEGDHSNGFEMFMGDGDVEEAKTRKKRAA